MAQASEEDSRLDPLPSREMKPRSRSARIALLPSCDAPSASFQFAQSTLAPPARRSIALRSAFVAAVNIRRRRSND